MAGLYLKGKIHPAACCVILRIFSRICAMHSFLKNITGIQSIPYQTADYAVCSGVADYAFISCNDNSRQII